MYFLVRRQYIDPCDFGRGFYPNEFAFLHSFGVIPSLKEVTKINRKMQKVEGKFPKYRYGYVKVTDLPSIWKV